MKIGRIFTVLAVMALTVVGFAGSAFAAVDSATVTAISNSATDVKDTLLETGKTLLPLVAAVLAFGVAVRYGLKKIRGMGRG